VVGKAAMSGCPAGANQIKGIGNEAARCRLPATHAETIDMISSRVRDIPFTVTLGLHTQKRSMNPEDDALEQTAEQVAGSLY
jgi:hypothetical protein